MAASTKKAKPKTQIKPTAKTAKLAAPPKTAKPAAKTPPAKLAKAKPGKSLPSKTAAKKPAAKPAAKPVSKPVAKDAGKKSAASAKAKAAPPAKPGKPAAKPVTPPPPARNEKRKEADKPKPKKDLNVVPPPAPAPVAAPPPLPVKPQVVIHKPRPGHRPLLPPPPPPPAPKPELRKPVAPAALRAFEHAVKIFNRRQFEEAKGLFEQLQQKFPQELELLSRAQMYLQVCQQKLAVAPPPAPTRNVSADELYDRGVYALNVGDFAQARSFFEKALRLNPNEPHFLYSLAATYAQTGPHEQALDFLRRSIQIQPRFRSQAFDDADFSGLRENRQFQELLGLTSPFDLLEARR